MAAIVRSLTLSFNINAQIAKVKSPKRLDFLQVQKRSGPFGRHPSNQSNLKAFKKLWLAGKKPALQKIHYFFRNVNRRSTNQLVSAT